MVVGGGVHKKIKGSNGKTRRFMEMNGCGWLEINGCVGGWKWKGVGGWKGCGWVEVEGDGGW